MLGRGLGPRRDAGVAPGDGAAPALATKDGGEPTSAANDEDPVGEGSQYGGALKRATTRLVLLSLGSAIELPGFGSLGPRRGTSGPGPSPPGKGRTHHGDFEQATSSPSSGNSDNGVAAMK